MLQLQWQTQYLSSLWRLLATFRSLSQFAYLLLCFQCFQQKKLWRNPLYTTFQSLNSWQSQWHAYSSSPNRKLQKVTTESEYFWMSVQSDCYKPSINMLAILCTVVIPADFTLITPVEHLIKQIRWACNDLLTSGGNTTKPLETVQ